MSFLNPVNEPVLRFKSTDAGAPQINYNARVAGDVKAVLKACLVTGYGTKASAGWSIVNEVGHVAEFVSPSAAMSDYRFKADDSSASSLVWSYTQSEVSKSLGAVGSVNKSPSSDVQKTNSSNGWELLVTAQGFWFIDALYIPILSGLACHFTYFGRVKSALLLADSVDNIGFSAFGVLDTSVKFLRDIFSEGLGTYYRIGGYEKASWAHAAAGVLGTYGQPPDSSAVNVTDNIYLLGSNKIDTVTTNAELIGQMPGLLMRTVSYSDKTFNLRAETAPTNRPVLVGRPGRMAVADVTFYYKAARGEMMIYTDYWEY